MPLVPPIKTLQHQTNDMLNEMGLAEGDNATQTETVVDTADKMSLYLAQVLDVSETENTSAIKQPPQQQQQQQPSDVDGNCVIRSTQMRRLNFEPKPTISDVYHERKIGLGLAPSLLKLLSLDKMHPTHSAASGKDKTGGWLSPSVLKRFGAESAYGELNRRDEGDGRSVAESQSSTSSYKKRVDPTSMRNFESLVEEDHQQKSSSTYNREPMKIRLKKKSSCVPPPPMTTDAPESSSSSPSASSSNPYIVDL